MFENDILRNYSKIHGVLRGDFRGFEYPYGTHMACCLKPMMDNVLRLLTEQFSLAINRATAEIKFSFKS